jgi:hypothetical protein
VIDLPTVLIHTSNFINEDTILAVEMEQNVSLMALCGEKREEYCFC